MKYSFMALSKWRGKQKNMIMMMEYDGWMQNDYGDKRVEVLRDIGVIWVWGTDDQSARKPLLNILPPD